MSSIYNSLSDCFQWLLTSKKEEPTVKQQDLPKISLHDGQQVSEVALKSTLLLLNHLHEQPFRTFLEFDLYQKATNSSYSFPQSPIGPSSPGELQKLGLLDPNNHMHKDVAIIVQNAFKEGTFGVVRLNPLTGEQLAKDYTWSELSAAFSK